MFPILIILIFLQIIFCNILEYLTLLTLHMAVKNSFMRYKAFVKVSEAVFELMGAGLHDKVITGCLEIYSAN